MKTEIYKALYDTFMFLPLVMVSFSLALFLTLWACKDPRGFRDTMITLILTGLMTWWFCESVKYFWFTS